MKGLLLKDLYILKGLRKQYAIVLIFMIIWSILMKNTSFGAMYAILLGGMLVLTTMSTDEVTHFNPYALTMPISARTLVMEKYLLLLISIGCGTVLGILINGINSFFPKFGEGFDPGSILAVGSVFIITYSITLPIIYKLGVEKSRYTYILILFILAGLIFGVVKLASVILGVPIESLPSPSTTAMIIAILLVDIAAFIISYSISLRTVSKKEW